MKVERTIYGRKKQINYKFTIPDEWATTKQACRDELVVYLFFSPIYSSLYSISSETNIRSSFESGTKRRIQNLDVMANILFKKFKTIRSNVSKNYIYLQSNLD